MYRERYSKYGNKKTECLKGHKHDSKFEAGVCDELRIREIAGDIKSYETQVTVRLFMEKIYMGSQRVDFLVHHFDGTKEYLEAKGLAMQKWKRDWAIMQHMFRNNPLVKFTVVRC